jgi:cell division septation protein DedD
VGHFETQRAAEEFKKSSGFKEGKIVRTAYANKIADFVSKDEAEKTVASLRNAGHSPYVIKDPKEGYRVFVGAYIAKGSADNMAGKLKQAGIESTVVFR